MTDDLLKRATGALREETSEPELRSGLTRSRLLDSAAHKNRAAGNPLRWVVPFVLTLGAGTALAHVTHQHFPEVWNALVPEALEQPVAPKDEAPRTPKIKQVAKKRPELVAPAPVIAPEIVAPAPIVEPAPVPAPERTKPSKPKRAALVETPALEPATPVVSIKPAASDAPAPAESAELALFRRAMKLHDGKDRNAIAAWDDFLRVAPKSPLATEARYNRALGLVRADRSREAKAALAPFASGDFGGYRKREAAQLLQALEQRDGGAPD